ncbi:MAG: hypothetical protein K2Y71_27470 [Xanthobacteraceae bacterium]|nr:hypothetical protein [Xanthobacteraceae bacterium]
MDRNIRTGQWPTPMTHVLRGKMLGIVGLGYVGRHVARMRSECACSLGGRVRQPRRPLSRAWRPASSMTFSRGPTSYRFMPL